MASALLVQLNARDRALFERLLLRSSTARRSRRFAAFVTHLGGASASLVLSLLPLLWGDTSIATRALKVLVLSHLIVQLVKRTIGRPRPSLGGSHVLVAEPDRFSFPSGHAAAAMSLAIAYAAAWPALALPITLFAAVVGLSRVCLGVHYPGDVVAGQLIAAATALALRMA